MALKLTHNTVNQDVFYDFVRGSLIPQMRPFDDISSASVAVMGNLSIHYVEEITDHFQQVAILLFFLPPYSPDLNPVEEAFSYAKYYLQKHYKLPQSIPDATIIVHQAFESITSKHCQA